MGAALRLDRLSGARPSLRGGRLDSPADRIGETTPCQVRPSDSAVLTKPGDQAEPLRPCQDGLATHEHDCAVEDEPHADLPTGVIDRLRLNTVHTSGISPPLSRPRHATLV